MMDTKLSTPANKMMSELNNPLGYAIEHEQPEEGIMNDYPTEEDLTILYGKIEQTSLLSRMLKEINGKKLGKYDVTLWMIGQIIQQLTMDTYEPLYLSDKERFDKKYLPTAVSKKKVHRAFDNSDHGSSQLFAILDHNIHNKSEKQQSGAQPQFDPIRELFLYAILLNRQEMARKLWERIDEPIVAALTASKLLKAMACKKYDQDPQESMMEHADKYEELAIGVLKECYYDQEELKQIYNILTREIPNWGHASCMTMAVEAQSKKFIVQLAVHNVLRYTWMGELSPENNYWKLLLYMFCPPMVACDVRFREDEHRTKDGRQYAVTAYDQEMAERGDIENASAEPDRQNLNTTRHHNDGQLLLVLRRLKLFYDAPIIKFRLNVVSQLAFLFLFSYIILTQFEEEPVRLKERFLIAWVGTLYLEEVRQIAHSRSNCLKDRLLHWFNDFWNMVDLATLLLFGIGAVLRFIPGMIGPARIVLALDLIGFYMRLLQSFYVSERLGPKLIMIARMMKDLLFFACILAVFLISYGIASQAIMFPNATDPLSISKGIFYKAYFQMYGELFLDDIQPEECTLDDPCPEYSWMGVLLLSIYMMLSNVLLLNLLIAMFSYTFSKVQGNADDLWRLQRYEVVNEYSNRPPFIPPLNFIVLISVMVYDCFRRLTNYKLPADGIILRVFGKKKVDVEALVLWEKNKADAFIAKEISKQNVEDRVQKHSEMMEELLGNSLTDSDRLSKIEHQLVRTNKAMEWIMKSLITNKLSSGEEPPDIEHIDSGSGGQ